jgi:prevent-host-death family protein
MYSPTKSCCTIEIMEVAVSELRANLSAWLERVRRGEEVVVTDRGLPVARLLGVETVAKLERLTAEGVIGRPATARRPSAATGRRPRARHSVADLVGEQRH